MTERLDVDAPAPLLEFLRSGLDGWSARTIRIRLRSGCIRVNGETVTRHDHPLTTGDRVDVASRATAEASPRRRGGLSTLHLDDHLIAIDKPAGLLSVSTDHERRRTALALARDSLSLPGRPAQLWPVHRLDRETSGVLLFARSKAVCEDLQAAWTDARKIYLAVVEGCPRVPRGVVDQPLWEDRSLNVRVGRREGAKDARTRYRTLARGRRRTLLEVELETGRRHQIRAHLAWLGHPVVGDRRYGAVSRRLGLHALRLRVTHPRDGSLLELEAPPPPAFSSLLSGDS